MGGRGERFRKNGKWGNGVPRGSKIEIFKNVWEYFSSVGGSKICVFSIFPDLGGSIRKTGSEVQFESAEPTSMYVIRFSADTEQTA